MSPYKILITKFLLQRISNIKNLISKSAKKLQNNATIFRDNKEIEDNKYNYDNKKNSLSSADHDHPLKPTPTTEFSFSNLSLSDYNNEVNQIHAEINSVALDWKSPKSVKKCTSCEVPFDQVTKKTHCQRCGNVRHFRDV